MIPRSFLFVPGDSERKLAKGAESGADALILDLEDSVAPERKALARDMVADCLATRPGTGPRLWVRINPLPQGGLDDLATLTRARPDGFVIPKAEHPSDLLRIGHMLDALERRDGVAEPIPLLPIATETARAPFTLSAYAETAVPRLRALTWGAEDLATALGARTNREPDGQFAFTYRLARSLCLMAARSAGLPAIDTLHADFRDEAGLRESCAAAAREGFSGRLAIHPAQVGPINEAFTPSEAETAAAARVVSAFAANPGTGVVSLDGRMFDMPHLKQAQALLALSEALRKPR